MRERKQPSLFETSETPSADPFDELARQGLEWHARERKALGVELRVEPVPRVVSPSQEAVELLADSLRRLARSKRCEPPAALEHWQGLVKHKQLHEARADRSKFRYCGWRTCAKWENVERWAAWYGSAKGLAGKRAMDRNIAEHERAKRQAERERQQMRERAADPTVPREERERMGAGFLEAMSALAEGKALAGMLPPPAQQARATQNARAGRLTSATREQLDRMASEDREHRARDDRQSMLDRMAMSEEDAAEREGREPRSREELARLCGVG